MEFSHAGPPRLAPDSGTQNSGIYTLNLTVIRVNDRRKCRLCAKKKGLQLRKHGVKYQYRTCLT